MEKAYFSDIRNRIIPCLDNATFTTFFLPFQHFYFQKHRGNVDFLLTLGHQKNIEWRKKHKMFRLQWILQFQIMKNVVKVRKLSG